MAGSVNPQDVAERDDAHLRSLAMAARGREDHVETHAATGEAVIG